MIFEFIVSQLAGYATGASLERIRNSITDALADKKAFNHATEALRPKYEKQLLPIDFDIVAEIIRITRHDLSAAFLECGDDSSAEDFIEDLLKKRLSNSPFDSAIREAAPEIIPDFVRAYQSYFSANDVLISLAETHRLSKEIIVILKSANNEVQESERSDHINRKLTEVRSHLRASTRTFSELSVTDKYADFEILDDKGLLPIVIYLRTNFDDLTMDSLDAFRSLRLERRTTDQFILSADRIPENLKDYARSHSIHIESLSSVYDKLLTYKDRLKIVYTEKSKKELATQYHIDKVFIEPDVVPSIPSDVMEHKFFSQRMKAAVSIHEFAKSADAAKILFLFGAYGSGKTALCAHIVNNPGVYGFQGPAVYVELASMQESDTLNEVVRKACDSVRSHLGIDEPSVVILDGLDEHIGAMSPIRRRQNMLDLLQSTKHIGNIIVASRTAYFRGLEDFWRLFRREDDSSFWADISKHLSSSSSAPSVYALNIREFDSDQVKEYLCNWDDKFGNEDEKSTFDDIFQNDRGLSMINLAKTPLYLFLLASSKPWKNGKAKCSSDVAHIFIRYWLERDVEKGASRWRLATDDRLDFSEFLAVWMFEHQRHSVSIAELEEVVDAFFGNKVIHDENYSLVLDLQTTGLFSVVGNSIQFVCTLFFDYLVVRHFMGDVAGSRRLKRPITADQLMLWLGLIESHGKNDVNSFFASLWLDDWGIKHVDGSVTKLDAADISPKGVLFGATNGRDPWKRINSPAYFEHRNLALSMWRSYLATRTDKYKLLILNWRGFHARAIHRFTIAYEKWTYQLNNKSAYSLTVVADGMSVEPNDLMGLMMLARGTGSVVEFEVEGLTENEMAGLFERIHAVKIEGVERGWATYFGEQEMDSLATLRKVNAELPSFVKKILQ